MSTESNDQYRAGFEAWAREYGLDCDYVSGPSGDRYLYSETTDAFEAWTASKREASTEPSALRLPQDGITHQLRSLVEWAYDQGSRFGAEITAEQWFYEAEESGSLAKRIGAAGALPDEATEAARYRELLTAVIAEFPSRMGRTRGGNAPGHCHDKPGIWDSDNGALAGKECAWCKVWNSATAAIEAQAQPGSRDE